MQLAVVEFARSVAKLRRANSTEIDSETPHPVIDILLEQKEVIENSNYGATMRLGAWPAVLKGGSIAYDAYSKSQIANSKSKRRNHLPLATRNLRVFERHRHRYEVNPEYIERLERKGLIFSGISPDRRLMEIAELPKNEHPFFLGTQFHPEFKSWPLVPHPLFKEFIKAAIKK